MPGCHAVDRSCQTSAHEAAVAGTGALPPHCARADLGHSPVPSGGLRSRGAFDGASSRHTVVERLQRQGHQALAPALPLRGLAAAYIRSFLDNVPGPIVLVGHSYGGAVISVAAADACRVKALVYIAAFVPDIGESALELTDKYPGSTLAQATCTQ
ncbi:alpha/beta fold hydrolase [Streptomyces chartreusis]|uniref:alpha/beta fold hydrolase n=1 Tax=Streptomyces chartreusis TaxID=1969 RepID=UPI0033AB81A6